MGGFAIALTVLGALTLTVGLMRAFEAMEKAGRRK